MVCSFQDRSGPQRLRIAVWLPQASDPGIVEDFEGQIFRARVATEQSGAKTQGKIMFLVTYATK
jgi:hypothetical protein